MYSSQEARPVRSTGFGFHRGFLADDRHHLSLRLGRQIGQLPAVADQLVLATIHGPAVESKGAEAVAPRDPHHAQGTDGRGRLLEVEASNAPACLNIAR